MANNKVRLRIDHPKMRVYVGSASEGAVKKAADAAQTRYTNNIRAAGLVNTGELINSVTQAAVPGSSPMKPARAVGAAAKHAKYQEFGTRAHGPVRAKALRFKPKGSSTFVFAKWVRGVRPQRFAQRALDSIRPTDFE